MYYPKGLSMPRIKSIQLRLHVVDLARSVEFYCSVLGFQIGSAWPDDKPVFAILVRDDVCLQISQCESPSPRSPAGACTVYIDVEDAVAFHEAVKDRVTIEWGPEVYFYGRREFGFRDPDGHLIIISEETSDPVVNVSRSHSPWSR